MVIEALGLVLPWLAVGWMFGLLGWCAWWSFIGCEDPDKTVKPIFKNG